MTTNATPFADFPDAPDTVGNNTSTDTTPFADFPDDTGAGTTSSGTVLNPGVMGEAAIKSGIEGVTTTVGAGLGLAGGTALGGPVGGVAGLVGGGAAGLKVGEAVTGFLGLKGAESVSAQDRPSAVAGENLGGAAGMILPIGGAASMGIRFAERGLGKWFNQIIDTAKRSKYLFAAGETSTAVGAAVGGYAATSVTDSNLARFGGELAGGATSKFTNPIALAGYAYRLTTYTASKFTNTAQQNKVASVILEGLRNSGEDPGVVIRALKESDPKGFENLRTAGSKTGSTYLSGLERALVEHAGDFGNESRQKADDFVTAIQLQMGALISSGNPRALKAVAEIRNTYTQALLSSAIDRANADSVLAISKLKGGSATSDKSVISADASNAMLRVYHEAEDVERNLWGAVKVNPPATTANTEAAIAEILKGGAQELEGIKIPKFLVDGMERAKGKRTDSFEFDPETFVIKDAADTPAQLPVSELIDFRSQILLMKRVASVAVGQQGSVETTRLSQLQEALLKDIDTALGKIGDTTYTEARDFTRTMSEVFNRSFSGESMGLTKFGERVPPELLIKRAFAGGADAANLKLKDLEKATRFLETKGYGPSTATEDMLNAQEQFYRVVTAGSVGKDGRVNPVQVRKYIEDNSVLFNRAPFTEIKKDLLDSLKSEEGLRRLEDIAKRRPVLMRGESAFANIVRMDPVAYASRIMVSPGDREQQLVNMINLAKSAPMASRGAKVTGATAPNAKDALDGARSAVLQAGMDKAIGTGTGLNVDILKGFLTKPLGATGKSAIDIMVENGAMTKQHAANLNLMFDMFENVSRSRSLGNAATIPEDKMTIITALAAKVAGSKLVSATTTNSNLIIHGNVAKGIEYVMRKLPDASAKDAMIKLVNDPKALGVLLEKTMNSPADKMRQIRFFNAWLIQSGVNLMNPDEDKMPQMFTQ